MNSSQTKWLVGLALALFTLIAFTELRRPAGPPSAPGSGQLVPRLRPATVTRIEVTLSNTTVRAEFAAGQWRLTAPLSYPADPLLISALLEICSSRRPQVLIPASQIKSPAAFGLQPPQSIVRFHQGDAPIELRIGAHTPVNNQIYIQVAGSGDIAIADANLLGYLPQTADAWRDRSLFALANVKFDRLRVRTGARDLLLQLDVTNRLWRIALPTPPKRANTPLIEELLVRLRQWPVPQFVTDDPRADLESFGLHTPESELAFGTGTNDTLVVQFGKSPTNQPALVFARSLATTNVMLVPRDLLDALRADLWEFSEHRLLDALPAGAVDILQVEGREKFTLRLQTNAAAQFVWVADDALKTVMDPVLMQSFSNNLIILSAVELAKEVVTDFAPYGLASTARRISLLKSGTNAAGMTTNSLVARLEFGNGRVDSLFARRHDESSVYVVPRGDVDRLAWSLVQIQDRTVWSFTSNQVAAVTVDFDGQSRRLTRAPGGRWTEGAEPVDELKNLALEETMFRLGHLRAEQWSYLGTTNLPIYGIGADSRRISVELAGSPARTNTVWFGNMPQGRNPYAAVTDPRSGQPLVFEFPRALFRDYVGQYLGR
ncbi:MAG: DUF4340 domain-containing protein [Verrucomicrobia bacterium]|nr:DUF4340 domain-containing protein [Verrucomicrobiota bacterium]